MHNSLTWRGSMKYVLACVFAVSFLSNAATQFTSFDVWVEDENATGSDSKQLTMIDGDIIVAGGI